MHVSPSLSGGKPQVLCLLPMFKAVPTVVMHQPFPLFLSARRNPNYSGFHASKLIQKPVPGTTLYNSEMLNTYFTTLPLKENVANWGDLSQH